jgi:hypothetical protein
LWPIEVDLEIELKELETEIAHLTRLRAKVPDTAPAQAGHGFNKTGSNERIRSFLYQRFHADL